VRCSQRGIVGRWRRHAIAHPDGYALHALANAYADVPNQYAADDAADYTTDDTADNSTYDAADLASDEPTDDAPNEPADDAANDAADQPAHTSAYAQHAAAVTTADDASCAASD